METAPQKVTNQSKENWFKLNFTELFTIVWIIVGQRLGKNFDFGTADYNLFYFGWAIIGLIILKVWLKASYLQKFEGLLGWLKLILITALVMISFFGFVSVFAIFVGFISQFIPETITQTFLVIIWIVTFIILFVAGIYFVEKSATRK